MKIGDLEKNSEAIKVVKPKFDKESLPTAVIRDGGRFVKVHMFESLWIILFSRDRNPNVSWSGQESPIRAVHTTNHKDWIEHSNPAWCVSTSNFKELSKLRPSDELR